MDAAHPATVAPPPGGWFSHAAKVELTGASLMFVSGLTHPDLTCSREKTLVGPNPRSGSDLPDPDASYVVD